MHIAAAAAAAARAKKIQLIAAFLTPCPADQSRLIINPQAAQLLCVWNFLRR